jgi:hypothetical protein
MKCFEIVFLSTIFVVGWVGVTCLSIGGQSSVSEIILTSLNVVGTIPTEIGGLTLLARLYDVWNS